MLGFTKGSLVKSNILRIYKKYFIKHLENIFRTEKYFPERTKISRKIKNISVHATTPADHSGTVSGVQNAAEYI